MVEGRISREERDEGNTEKTNVRRDSALS